MIDITITRESPLLDDLAPMMARHAADMHAAGAPPESMHFLDVAALAAPGIDFFVMRDGARPVGMGALKRINAGHAEIKSMHILAERRGQGLSRVMLDHLLVMAKAAGYRRLSLETGAQPVFAPARALYAGAGFTECAAFEGYRPDPNSVFMTRDIG